MTAFPFFSRAIKPILQTARTRQLNSTHCRFYRNFTTYTHGRTQRPPQSDTPLALPLPHDLTRIGPTNERTTGGAPADSSRESRFRKKTKSLWISRAHRTRPTMLCGGTLSHADFDSEQSPKRMQCSKRILPQETQPTTRDFCFALLPEWHTNQYQHKPNTYTFRTAATREKHAAPKFRF